MDEVGLQCPDELLAYLLFMCPFETAKTFKTYAMVLVVYLKQAVGLPLLHMLIPKCSQSYADAGSTKLNIVSLEARAGWRTELPHTWGLTHLCGCHTLHVCSFAFVVVRARLAHHIIGWWLAALRSRPCP